jgi:hypothetical protein
MATYDEVGAALHALILAVVAAALYACNRRS